MTTLQERQSTLIRVPIKGQEQTHKDFWQHPARAELRVVDARQSLIEVVPRRKKVALVGFAETTFQNAPFDDPTWEVWGMNQLYRHIRRFDRWYEIHTEPVFTADIVRDTNYVEWLRTAPVPVYMVDGVWDLPAPEDPEPEVGSTYRMKYPSAVRVPFERIAALRGKKYAGLAPYLQSTIGYMLALAILEGFETIGLWGIDLIVGSEYEYQKPNAEFWVGFAEARGIDVIIPPESALCKQLYCYGPEVEPNMWPYNLTDYDLRLQQLNTRREVVLTELNNLDGAISETNGYREMALMVRRGVKIAPMWRKGKAGAVPPGQMSQAPKAT